MGKRKRANGGEEAREDFNSILQAETKLHPNSQAGPGAVVIPQVRDLRVFNLCESQLSTASTLETILQTAASCQCLLGSESCIVSDPIGCEIDTSRV